MYIPRHYHWVYPLGFILGGFWIWQNVKPQTWDVIITGGVVMAHGMMYITYLYEAGLIYQKYITNMNTPEPRVEIFDEPYRDLQAVPEVNYNQVATMPQFDKERSFAVTLLRMYEYDPNQVDMTERKWVKTTKKFVRDELAAMLKNWEAHGVIGRKSPAKNSPYIVTRWDAVRLIASGNPLPKAGG